MPEKTDPSYHDVYVTTKAIQRTRLCDLPFSYELTCNRVSGWCLWVRGESREIGGEYSDRPLRIDIGGVVICDSFRTLPTQENQDE